jgi:hypothetical protein
MMRFVRFHGMKSRDDLQRGEPGIEQFLTHLAVVDNVFPSTQNQAMNALVFCIRNSLSSLLTAGLMPFAQRRSKTFPSFCPERKSFP